MKNNRNQKKHRFSFVPLAVLQIGILFVGLSVFAQDEREFTTDFRIEECTFSSVGRNPFFILEPGYQLTLEGESDEGPVVVQITVLDETKKVDNIVTRVVKEMEWEDGELIEVSQNYFAICNETNSVFYFGEDVDIYDEGEIVSHDGAWLAGQDGAEAGILMPGTILLGSRYYQEIAPGVAMDRAEIMVMDATVETLAGTFSNCLETLETTPLEPSAEDSKFYAPGIGLIVDAELSLAEIPINPPGADLNRDGLVDERDLLLFRNNWHRGNEAD